MGPVVTPYFSVSQILFVVKRTHFVFQATPDGYFWNNQ